MSQIVAKALKETKTTHVKTKLKKKNLKPCKMPLDLGYNSNMG